MVRVHLLLPKHTQVCFFCCSFLFYATDPLFLKLWGYGEDAIACRNTLGVARTCLARTSPLASTKAHASVLFLLPFCILHNRPSFFCNCGGTVKTRLPVAIRWVSQALPARTSLLASTKAHASVLFLLPFCILHHCPSFF